MIERCPFCDSPVRVLGDGVVQCKRYHRHFTVESIWIDVEDGVVDSPEDRCPICTHCGDRADHVLYQYDSIDQTHVETTEIQFVCNKQYSKQQVLL